MNTQKKKHKQFKKNTNASMGSSESPFLVKPTNYITSLYSLLLLLINIIYYFHNVDLISQLHKTWYLIQLSLRPFGEQTKEESISYSKTERMREYTHAIDISIRNLFHNLNKIINWNTLKPHKLNKQKHFPFTPHTSHTYTYISSTFSVSSYFTRSQRNKENENYGRLRKRKKQPSTYRWFSNERWLFPWSSSSAIPSFTYRMLNPILLHLPFSSLRPKRNRICLFLRNNRRRRNWNFLRSPSWPSQLLPPRQ